MFIRVIPSSVAIRDSDNRRIIFNRRSVRRKNDEKRTNAGYKKSTPLRSALYV